MPSNRLYIKHIDAREFVSISFLFWDAEEYTNWRTEKSNQVFVYNSIKLKINNFRPYLQYVKKLFYIS